MIRHADPPIPAELLAIPDHLMPETDGKPMDSEWHRDCMVLLIEVVDVHRGETTTTPAATCAFTTARSRS